MFAFKEQLTQNEGEHPSTELCYWRKHNRLHGWMEETYYEQGGEAPTFNCVRLYLDEDTLDALQFSIENMNLPETHGFFFGDDSYDDYEEALKKKDLQFIKDAKQAISEGFNVYYTSWW